MTDPKLLIHAFNSYDNLSVERYFALRYETIPTTAKLQVPVSPARESYKRVIELLDLETYGTSVLYRDWTIAKHSDAAAGDDYIDYALLASENGPLCIELNIYSEFVSVEFQYATDDALEAWVFTQIAALRNAFSKKRKPVFRVLTRSKGEFRTRTVDVEWTEADLNVNYNDDLIGVDNLIQNAIKEKTSGLILLHGIPGTGKTSYIKTLLSRNMEENFIFIPNDFVDEMLKPAFITFLIAQKNSTLVVEDAESVIMSRNQSGNKSVVSTILQITDGLFSDYLNIKVICTFNTDVSRIDKALFRKGRMIAFYEFKELTEEKAMKLVGVDSPGELPETRTLAELYNRKERSFDVQAGKRKIGFA